MRGPPPLPAAAAAAASVVMGVRNDAAAASSIRSQNTNNNNGSSSHQSTNPAAMAVNDNSHLTLSELQQMAAFQQQQIQAQQSLLMAKVIYKAENDL